MNRSSLHHSPARQLTLLIMLIAAVIAATADSASCSGLATMVEQMRTGKVKLAEINAEKESLTAQNERDLKEYTAYSESFVQLEVKAQSLKDNFKKETGARLDSANQIVTNFNTRCGGKPLDEATYNSCNAELGRIRPQVQSIRDGVDRDVISFNKNQIAPITDIQKRQKTAMEELDIRMKARFEKWLKVNEKSDELTARLANLRSALVEACSTATTIESIKHCNAIGWDGARMDLPPLQ